MTKPSALSREDMMEAISEGVRRAIWAVATNATQMPCADFYDSITEGVEKGVKAHLERVQQEP